jgi:hypothetical protein
VLGTKVRRDLLSQAGMPAEGTNEEAERLGDDERVHFLLFFLLLLLLLLLLSPLLSSLSFLFFPLSLLLSFSPSLPFPSLSLNLK